MRPLWSKQLSVPLHLYNISFSMYFNSTVSKVSTNQLYNRRRDFVLLAEVIFPQQRKNKRKERSLHDETLLKILF